MVVEYYLVDIINRQVSSQIRIIGLNTWGGIRSISFIGSGMADLRPFIQGNISEGFSRFWMIRRFTVFLGYGNDQISSLYNRLVENCFYTYRIQTLNRTGHYRAAAYHAYPFTA